MKRTCIEIPNVLKLYNYLSHEDILFTVTARRLHLRE